MEERQLRRRGNLGGPGHRHRLRLPRHDTVPDYLDTAPLPAPGQTALWKYKAIYRLNDEQVGLWSNEVSLAVRG